MRSEPTESLQPQQPSDQPLDGLLRGYLYEAANALLTRVKRFSTLKAWGVRFTSRHGGRKARVAIARKLSVIMHRMLITREPFRWSAVPGAANPA